MFSFLAPSRARRGFLCFSPCPCIACPLSLLYMPFLASYGAVMCNARFRLHCMSCTPSRPVPLSLCFRIRGNREILFYGNTRRGRGLALPTSHLPVMFRPCNSFRLPVSFSRFALSFRSAYPQDVLCLQFLNPSLDYTAKPHNLVTLFTRSVQVTE